MKLRSKKQLGFTLIEMMVSLGLFSIVITITVGALLMLVATNQQLQAEQNVMTNLSFAIDSMTREIRTGTHYYCVGIANYNPSNNNDQILADADSQENVDTYTPPTQDCLHGNPTDNRIRGISFREGGNSITTGSGKRIAYFFDGNSGGPYEGKIMRRVGDAPAQSIVSSNIFINNALFIVTGSDTGINDDQPAVTILIEASEKENADKTYKIQTTVTQRTLDI